MHDVRVPIKKKVELSTFFIEKDSRVDVYRLLL